MEKAVAFGWRTAMSVLLIVDYFLFSTGNPSVTYSVLGGWFIVPLVVAVIVTALYGLRAYEAKSDRRVFLLHCLIIAVVSVVLLSLSEEARERAIANLEADVVAFVNDPTTPKSEASDKTRALLTDIKKQRYSMKRDTFIPTFRRMDYMVKTERGQKFVLILVVKWNGVPTFALLPEPN